MSPASDQFTEYLAPEERLVAVHAVSFSESSSWKAASLGITDRRLLCVAEDGSFLTVGYDAISTIRSRPRTTHTYRGNDYRLLLGSGGLVAVLGFVGVVALTTGPFVPILALVTVGALVAAAYLRRTGDEMAGGTVARVTEAVPSDFDGWDVPRRYERYVPDGADEHQLLTIGCGLVAVVGFVGVVLLAASGLAVLATLVLVGGVALIDHARRRKDDLDGLLIVRDREQEVSIRTDTDRVIHVRSDRSEAIDRGLSRVAFVDEEEPD